LQHDTRLAEKTALPFGFQALFSRLPLPQGLPVRQAVFSVPFSGLVAMQQDYWRMRLKNKNIILI
jgi:hypothetical protein